MLKILRAYFRNVWLVITRGVNCTVVFHQDGVANASTQIAAYHKTSHLTIHIARNIRDMRDWMMLNPHYIGEVEYRHVYVGATIGTKYLDSKPNAFTSLPRRGPEVEDDRPGSVIILDRVIVNSVKEEYEKGNTDVTFILSRKVEMVKYLVNRMKLRLNRDLETDPFNEQEIEKEWNNFYSPHKQELEDFLRHISTKVANAETN